MNLNIGILALQGDIDEHAAMLRQAGLDPKNIIYVKSKEQLAMVDGLILPGGESTTMKKLLLANDFSAAFNTYIASKKPIFGTCAGLILLAKKCTTPELPGLGVMDITVERNAFGRQINSFEEELVVKGLTTPFNTIFIRGPKIASVDSDAVEILAETKDAIVFVRQDNYFAASFHPELTDDSRIHQLFLTAVEEFVTARNKSNEQDNLANQEENNN